MNTIINLIITSVICLTLTSAILKTSESNKIVILQTTDSKVTSQLLTQSAKIISERLKIYGLKSIDVNIIADKGQLEVQLPDNLNISEIEGLLTSKGKLAFYETLTLKEIADLLKNKNHLDQLKNDPKTSLSDARIGCATFEDHVMVDTIENYLKSINLSSNHRLCWGLRKDKSVICLYALKTNEMGKALLLRSDVETIKSSPAKDSQAFNIEIKFKLTSSKIWATATKNNFGKPIAIVIDDKVFYTPVVKTTIENGLCEISGNLSQKEADYFLALVNNDPLPLDLNLK
jgi:SecD/SecF fusion protein